MPALTGAFGINDRGDIVGEFADDIGLHGFLLSQGEFTTLNPNSFFSGGFNSSATGINANGDIVGSYIDSSGQPH